MFIKRLTHDRLIGVTTNKTSLGWPKGGCGRLVEVELYQCQEMVCILVKDNIEASLHDRGGLFCCDPPSFPVIFFITLPFEGLKKTVACAQTKLNSR